jgi:hypothetical protein
VKDESVFARLIDIAPAEIATVAHLPERCVLATAIGCQVLAYFGIEARPRPVTAAICNAAFITWWESGRAGGVEAAQAAGAWSLLPDAQASERAADGRRRWNGHLVIDVPSAHALIDLDLRQFRRPAKAIELPDAALFQYEEGIAAGTFESSKGCRIIFGPLDDDRWRQTLDWRRGSRDRHVIGRIIRKMKSGEHAEGEAS